MGKVYRKYTREVLGDAVANSTSVAGVLRYLGLNQAGGTHSHLSRTIKAMELDTSHFVRHRNGSAARRRTARDILVLLPRGSRRMKPPFLRRALEEIGRPHRCEGCGNEGWWQGRPLRLDVDHIDGDYHNNLACNLRFLCPNCHSQTPNFAGRSRGRYTTIDQAMARPGGNRT
ncbi:HNH endonuclease signature motif containing protein [Nocardioides sp.]|uniref:HNH endonuclease signature motif containing protein n=1 Tax=Nocardioides sp. TaxID=35761 RepID=UPI002ED6561E